MKMSKDIMIKIDMLLQMAFDDGQIFLSKQLDDNTDKAFRICKSLNLIRRKNTGLFELDEKGVFAIQDGGIEKYLSNIGTGKDLDLVIKQLTSKRLKYEIWYNLMYVVFGAIIGIFPTLVKPDNSERNIQELNKTVKQEAYNDDSFQTDIQQMRSEITSLQKQIDSLKSSKN